MLPCNIKTGVSWIDGEKKPEPTLRGKTAKELGVGNLLFRFQDSLTREEHQFPPDYHSQFTPFARLKGGLSGGFVIVALITMIVVYALFMSGHLTTLPQDIAGLFTSANVIPLVGAGAGCAFFIGGVVFVIYRALYIRKHELLGGKTLGRFNTSQLERVCLDYELSDGTTAHFMAYLDRSTLTGKGKERAYIYGVKGVDDHYGISTQVAMGTVPYLIGVCVYNLIRVAVIPFYIATCFLIEKCNGPIFENEEFGLTQIPQEMAHSLERAIKAPFYATALFFAALYSFACPVNGRRLGAAIEFDWNEGTYRSEGRWLTIGSQKLHKGLEGGGSPEGIQKNQATTLPGCWHPIAVAEFENGKVVRVVSITRALLEMRNGGNPIHGIDPSQGYEYTMCFESEEEEEMEAFSDE